MNKNIIFDIAIILFFVIQAPQLLEPADFDDPNNNDIFNEDAYFNYEEYVYGKSNFDEISKKALGEMNLRWERYILNADNDFFSLGKNENKENNEALRKAVNNNKKQKNAGYSNKEDRNNIDNHLKNRENNLNNQKKSGRSNKSSNSNNTNNETNANRIVSANSKTSSIVQKLQNDKNIQKNKIALKESEKKSIGDYISNTNSELNVEEGILTELLNKKVETLLKKDMLALLKEQITLKINQLRAQVGDLTKRIISLGYIINIVAGNANNQDMVSAIQSQINYTQGKINDIQDEITVAEDKLAMVSLELQDTQKEISEIGNSEISSKADISLLEAKVEDAESKEDKVEGEINNEKQEEKDIEKDIAEEKNTQSQEENAKDVGRGPVDNSPERSDNNPFSSNNIPVQYATLPNNIKDPEEEEENPEGEQNYSSSVGSGGPLGATSSGRPLLSSAVFPSNTDFRQNISQINTKDFPPDPDEFWKTIFDTLNDIKNTIVNWFNGNKAPQPTGAQPATVQPTGTPAAIPPVSQTEMPSEAQTDTLTEEQIKEQQQIATCQGLLQEARGGTAIGIDNLDDVLWMTNPANSSNITVHEYTIPGGEYVRYHPKNHIENGQLIYDKYDIEAFTTENQDVPSHKLDGHYDPDRKTQNVQNLITIENLSRTSPHLVEDEDGTYCNQNTFDNTLMAGWDLRNMINFDSAKNILLKDVDGYKNEDLRYLTGAAEQLDEMDLAVTRGELVTVTAEMAQAMANEGFVVVAGVRVDGQVPSHLAPVYPSDKDYDPEKGPLISNVGKYNEINYAAVSFQVGDNTNQYNLRNDDGTVSLRAVEWDDITYYVDLEQNFNYNENKKLLDSREDKYGTYYKDIFDSNPDLFK